MAPIDELGIADALVAMLKHESRYCVAAAASTLQALGETPGGGHALVEASGAIPALVRVIGGARPPFAPDIDTGMSRKCVF